MIASMRQRLNPINIARDIQSFLRNFIVSGDLLMLLITFVLVLQPALSLEAAEWPLMIRVVLPVILIATLFGYLIARTHYNELIALVVNTFYGFIVIMLVAAVNETGNLFDSLISIIERTAIWFADAISGGINQDPLVFTLLVATLFWLLAYNATWHIFRIARVWRTIFPPAVILMANVLIYTGEESLDLYLIIFVFASLLLLAHSTLDERQWDWYVNRVRVPRKMHNQFLMMGAILASIVLLIVSLIPTNDLQNQLEDFQEFLNQDPVQQFAELWNRLVEPIESEGPATVDYYGSDSLNLGGAINLGDQVVMLVQAPNDRRYYWRSRIFERYSSGNWSPSATFRVPDLQAPLDVVHDSETLGQSRISVAQTFTISSGGTRILYTAPQPSVISVAGRIDLSYTREGDDTSAMNVSVIRPTRVLERGVSYDAVSLISVATANDLRLAGTDYPEWVANPNTFVSASVSPRVVQLARDIVTEAGATNPYDQSKAIERWLRTNITYDDKIPSPPLEGDPLEWFIFELRAGYCTYYASAMINMLRSLGIPARMAAGFSMGEWDASLNQYVVRERDAHTWVEVYFPGFGWIEFEPTADESPLDRDGDTQFEQTEQSSPTPPPTNTPFPTNTPTPAPTSTPNDDAQSPPELPTVTLTPSPTATATPIIVPTVAPPIQPPPPPNQDFLSFILPAVGVALVIFSLIALLVIISIIIYWWWEWRGMGGLSPVSRAYARLERYIPLLGIRTRDEQTTEEKRAQIVNELPMAERPITTITRSYTVERYDKKRMNEDVVEQAWTETRGSIIRRWIRRFIPFIRNR